MLSYLLFAAVVAALPQASAEKVFSVFNFGARGDGKHNDTAAIQAALDRAAAAGGGVAHLPANGTFLTGGGLNALGHAYDGVTLRVDGAVTIPGPAAKPLWSTPAQCGTAEHVKGSGGKGTDQRRPALHAHVLPAPCPAH
jgi:polygalacturonase